VNALKMYETKINGEHKKSSQQLKSEQKKLEGRAVPRKRLEGEISDITVKIATTKEGIVALKEQKVAQEDEGSTQKKARQLEIDQVVRERKAQERLLDSYKATRSRLQKEIEETQAGLAVNDGESSSMNAHFSQMEAEAAEQKAKIDIEQSSLEDLEAEEKSLQAQQDAVQGAHQAQLQEQEALLAALREVADMRDGHAASLRGLRQMARENNVLSELVDQELARLSSQRTTDEAAQNDAAGKRETILHAIKESESQFVESLKSVSAKIKAQHQTQARLGEYSKNVKMELEYATVQLLEHNCEKANLQENVKILSDENSKVEKSIGEVQDIIVARKIEEEEKQQEMDAEVLDYQSQVSDLSEQVEAEEQVLAGLDEYLGRTRVQLGDLDGDREQKAKFKLLEQCSSTFGSELEAVKKEHTTRKEALDEMEKKDAALKQELESETAKLTKEQREMAYKIEVDSRAVGIKRGYTSQLSSDVRASGVHQEPTE